MEKLFYLIPDGSLSPVSSGDGYRDYLLSSVIESLGYSSPVRFSLRGYRESRGSSSWLLYIDVVLPRAIVTIPPIARLNANPEDKYASLWCSDAIVRYMSGSSCYLSWTKLLRNDGTYVSII